MTGTVAGTVAGTLVGTVTGAVAGTVRDRLTGMTDPQKQADQVRELVAESDAVRRLHIEILRAVGTDDGVTLRARRGVDTFEANHAGPWLEEPPQDVARSLGRDLVADALGPAPPMADGSRWGRAADHAHRIPGPSAR